MEIKSPLTRRLIPCLDVKDGKVVKGVNFVNLVEAGDPVSQGKFYSEQGADELCFLDITASSDKRNIIIDLVRRVAEQVFIPFTVGGGIRTVDDVKAVLSHGADKVSINTAAFENPKVLTDSAKVFGSQCIVAAIDARHNGQNYEVYLHGGRTATGTDAVQWAYAAQEAGAGELLLTSMDRDGTKQGFDLELTRLISEKVSIPVIASGGVGTLDHLVDGITQGGADAVLAASIFHFREYSIGQAKQHMASAGVPVRPV